MIRALLCISVVWALSSCGYRFQAPPQLDQPVAIEIAKHEGRLMLSAGPLRTELADALNRRLGWRVVPVAKTTIVLTLHEEKIRSGGFDNVGITNSWQIDVRGEVLVRQEGIVLANLPALSFSGLCSSQGRVSEPTAVTAGAVAAAAQIAAWLETNGDLIAKVQRETPPAKTGTR